jgi:hypothetical protein
METGDHSASGPKSIVLEHSVVLFPVYYLWNFIAFSTPLDQPLSVFMPKEKEPKRQCRCGCGKMLSARAERRHRDGQVPPRIAAVQPTAARAGSPSRHLNTSEHRHRQDRHDISLDEEPGGLGLPTPMDFLSDDDAILQDLEPDIVVPEETVATGSIQPAAPAVNPSVINAQAAALSNWRKQRKAPVSDDEDDENSQHSGVQLEDSDDKRQMPEDDEDSEDDSNSVDDRIEAEWEKEWAEMGKFNV